MSVEMRQIPFAALMGQALREGRSRGTLFGVPIRRVEAGPGLSLFGGRMETPVGPAAGPHTQLAQNLIAAYGAGARFFELKTVQVLWGEQLGIQRPCIYVRDEGYNVEWSTELSPEQAAEEYIKGALALKLLSRELDLGEPEGFVFNLSVGYDLPGIQSPAVDRFLETMKDASSTPFWRACLEEAKSLPLERTDAAFLEGISPIISNNVTLSTMHGCPPAQIRAIAAWLLEEKGLNTYIKCNPTLLGYETCRRLLDEQGYTDIAFDREQFDRDMQLPDAVAMFHDLLALARDRGLRFGVKLTNTFPVRIQRGELPGDTMYLSGKALFPLSLTTAAVLSEAMEGTLPMSFSGGADETCAADLLRAGIWPVTVATLLLKAGGYRNLTKLARSCAGAEVPPQVDTPAIRAMEERHLRTGDHFRRRERVKAAGQQPPFSCGRCSTCVDVCPNRANYFVEGLEKKVVHLDGPCNDCGNCASVCPFGFRPYADKFVLYPDRETLLSSSRDGFLPAGDLYRWQGKLGENQRELPEEVQQFIAAVRAMDLAR